RCSPCSSVTLLRLPPSSPLFPYTTLFRSRPHPRRPGRSPRRDRPFPRPSEATSSHRLAHDGERVRRGTLRGAVGRRDWVRLRARSEEHTSELQSRGQLVCRLLLEKKENSP